MYIEIVHCRCHRTQARRAQKLLEAEGFSPSLKKVRRLLFLTLQVDGKIVWRKGFRKPIPSQQELARLVREALNK